MTLTPYKQAKLIKHHIFCEKKISLAPLQYADDFIMSSDFKTFTIYFDAENSDFCDMLTSNAAALTDLKASVDECMKTPPQIEIVLSKATWKEVHFDEYDDWQYTTTQRLKVPGGFIYRSYLSRRNDENPDIDDVTPMGSVFVPISEINAERERTLKKYGCPDA